MPNCTGERDLFGALGRRRIEVGFDGGEVSSDAGLLLLRQVERKLGLLKSVAPMLPDPRNPDLIVHTTEHLLRRRVFGLCLGYDDLNDHDQLRLDAALHAPAIMKPRTRRRRQAWPSVRVVCRGDSRCCRNRLLAWCERNDVGYVVRMQKSPRLVTMAAPWREQAQVAFEYYSKPQR